MVEHTTYDPGTYEVIPGEYQKPVVTPSQEGLYIEEEGSIKPPMIHFTENPMINLGPAAQLLLKAYQENKLSPERMAAMDTLKQRGELEKYLPKLAEKIPIEELKAMAGGPEQQPDFIGTAAPSGQRAIPEELGRQLGLTTRYAAQGAAGTIGLLSDPIATVMNQFLPESHKIKNFRDVVKDYLDKAGVPNPEGTTQKIIGQATEMGFASMGNIMGARGLMSQLTGTGQAVAEQMAAQPAQQVIAGATGGAAQQAAAEAGAGPAAQLAAGIGGAVLGSKAAMGPKITPAGMLEAEKLGMTVPTTDVFVPRTVVGKATQRFTERIPIAGTGGMRKGQYPEAQQAIRQTVEEFGLEVGEDLDKATQRLMKSLSAKRSADLTKYTGMKKDVINRLSQSGEVVATPNTIQQIDDEIANLKAINPEAYKQAIDFFEGFKGNLQDKTLNLLEENRKVLFGHFKDPNLATIRDEGQKAANRIYIALRKDMGSYIKETGERRDFDKWMVADRRLSNMSQELGVTSLKNALNKGDLLPDEVNTMLFNQKPGVVRILYKNLDPAGKANARQSILYKAVQNADGIENINPRKFATQVKKLGNSTGIFFKGQDAQKLEGLAKALEITKRGTEAGTLTMTGQETIPYVAGASLATLLGGPLKAVGVAAGLGVTARLYESRTVRNLLLQLARVKTQSPEAAQLTKRLIQEIENFKVKQGEKQP